MEKGRPSGYTIKTKFYSAGSNQYVNSLKNRIDVTGWQNFTGSVDKENNENGEGKLWSYNGEVYIGKFFNNKKTIGKLYKLQENGTYKISEYKKEERNYDSFSSESSDL